MRRRTLIWSNRGVIYLIEIARKNPSGRPGASARTLRDFVDRDALVDAAQRVLAGHGPQAAAGEQRRGVGMLDDGAGRVDRARIGEALDARGDVDGLAEIIL